MVDTRGEVALEAENMVDTRGEVALEAENMGGYQR
jgi:hypothetical protein